MNYLVENKILVKNQYAYRKLHSTVTSLIKSTDDWLSNIDSKKVNLTLFLNLKKAFDTVDHRILIDKLGAYGVKGTEIKWFTSHLNERRQFCRVNGYNSKTLRVTCGIPQGSCLGPLLFILYLNDFESCLQYSSTSMYADDTHTTIAARDIDELVQKTKVDLGNISEWMRIKKMSANPKKTEYMIIGNSSRINKITDIAKFEMNGTEIKKTHNVKSLGLIIDEKLSWNDHFKLLKGKITAGLSSLKKLNNILPQSKLCSVYRALVESHIRYADVVWANLSKTKLQTLQHFQDRALSIIQHARIKDEWQGYWLKVENLIKFDQAVMMFKINNQLGRKVYGINSGKDTKSLIIIPETVEI